MLNIADRPPLPTAGLGSLVAFAGFAFVFALTLFCVYGAFFGAGVYLQHHLSAEAAGHLVTAGSFAAGFLTCRIVSRRCRWA